MFLTARLRDYFLVWSELLNQPANWNGRTFIRRKKYWLQSFKDKPHNSFCRATMSSLATEKADGTEGRGKHSREL